MKLLGKPAYTWPDTSPIDKTDPYWEGNNNVNFNGTHYKKKEVAPGKWRWVINEKIESMLREHQKEKDDLLWALKTRVLSAEEMDLVRTYGTSLVIRPMQSYKESDKQAEFDAALLQQFYIRLAVEKAGEKK